MESDEESVHPTLDAALQLLEAEPDDYELAWQELRVIVQQLLIPSSIALLDPKDLGLKEIRDIIGLRTINFFLWGAEKPMPVPNYLQQNLSRIQALQNASPSDGNLAMSRIRADQVLHSALFEEQLQEDDGDTIAGLPQQLELHDRTPLTFLVDYQEEPRLLSTSADASIWYDGSQPRTLGAALLLVYASARNGIDGAISRLAACMGIAHLQRKSTGRAINGVVTDGTIFRFARIDAQGWWMLSRELDWTEKDHGRIYMYMRLMIREAVGLMEMPKSSLSRRPTVNFGSKVSVGGDTVAFLP